MLVALTFGGCFPGPIDLSDDGRTTTEVNADGEVSEVTTPSETGTDTSVPSDGGCATDCSELEQGCYVGVCLNDQCVQIARAGTCDDGLACTVEDQCQQGTCVGTPKVCEASASTCQENVCDPDTGNCELKATAEGEACEDGLVCTTNDKCTSGACVGVDVVCDDERECSRDACSEEGGVGCVVDLEDCPCIVDADCRDDLACNGEETCGADNQCVNGEPIVCPDNGDVCAPDVCSEESGKCEPRFTDVGCDDGDKCTLSDRCEAGQCVGTAKVCADQATCSIDGCNATSGLCESDTRPCECTASEQCDDGQLCNGQEECDLTTYTCTDPVDLPSNTTCNDGQYCTTDDHCVDGACAGVARVCQDALSCSVDTCDDALDTCVADVEPCGCIDSSSCDNGNVCDGIETCGPDNTCLVGTPVTCPAATTCRSWVCDSAAGGQCKPVDASVGTPCDDGDACTQADSCNSGVCVGSSPVVCSASDQCHTAGVCDPDTGTCSDPEKPDGADCSDGNACTLEDECTNGVCLAGAPKACTPNDQCHQPGVCNATSGECTYANVAAGTDCDDGNACTVDDECSAGVCAGDAVVCDALDQCHNPGQCNPGTGLCSDPVKPDTASCNDGNACTLNDKCTAGSCGGTAIVCQASDQCHDVGTCNTLTGVCTDPPKPNTASCNDGNPCTLNDTCTAGACGGTAVICQASDQCHDAGTCNTSTGICSNPAKPDTAPCNDGNACTLNDTCTAGSCGGTAVVCQASDQCHDAGTCNTSTGICSNPAKPDTATCNDGNACTLDDKCTAGSCGGAAVVCQASDQCHDAGTCNTSTGLCSNPAKPDTTSCNDGNACTLDDRCTAGSCGGTAKTCSAKDQCHLAGTCNTTTGICTDPPKPDTTGCNDGNLCTQSDQCTAGVCVGSNPVQCPTPDQCHEPGTCAPATGLCSNPPSVNGRPCDDVRACTINDQCTSGVCGGTVSCPALGPCREPGTCVPVTGECSSPAKPDGTGCEDGNLCTLNDMCAAGECVRTPKVCTASDQCHEPGVCAPGTGVCSNPASDDDKPCDDGEYCTTVDACQTGTCVGTEPPDDASSDWNIIRPGATPTALITAPGGGVWVIIESYSTLTLGPTASGGELSLPLQDGVSAAFVGAQYDADGRLVALRQLFGRTMSSPSSVVAVRTGDGFALSPTQPENIILPGGEEIPAPPNRTCVLALRYDLNGTLEWWYRAVSETACIVGATDTFDGQLNLAVISSSGATLSHAGATSIPLAVGMSRISFDSAGEAAVTLLNDEPGDSIAQTNLMARGNASLSWSSYRNQFAVPGGELLARGNSDALLVRYDEDDPEWAIGFVSGVTSMQSWNGCTMFRELTVCIAQIGGGSAFYNQNGDIYTTPESGTLVIAFDANGGYAWSRNFGTSFREIQRLDGDGPLLRALGWNVGALALDGVAVPGSDPGANRVGSFVAELEVDGSLVWFATVGSKPNVNTGFMQTWARSGDYAITGAGYAEGLVRLGIANPLDVTLENNHFVMTRVNSAGGLTCQ